MIDLLKLDNDATFAQLALLMDNFKLVKLGVGFKADLKAVLRRLDKSEMVRLQDAAELHRRAGPLHAPDEREERVAGEDRGQGAEWAN